MMLYEFNILIRPGLRDFGDLKLLWSCVGPVNLQVVAMRRHLAAHTDIFNGETS
jgi:hypothetical protein